MALDQSALLDLSEALRSAESVELMRRLLGTVLQALVEAEATARIGAEPHQRTQDRTTQRNGYRDKTVSTTTGDLTVKIPKLRAGSFFPSLLQLRRRIDVALHAVVMQAWVEGVSTRKVDDLVAALGIESGISKSEVWRICAGLDADVHAWRTRPLGAPDLPMLIGGRDRFRADRAAAAVGCAEGVVLDLAADDLGLGKRAVVAVAVLFTDERAAGLRFAQSRRAPYISMSAGIVELGPEVAVFVHQPQAAAVVLGTEWLVGATTVPALILAEAFSRVRRVGIGALLDELDNFGPAATADLDRQTKTMPAALAHRDGAWVWRVGDEARATLRAVDGTTMTASALSPHDVLGLAMATGAPDVSFDFALGESSLRRRGQPLSTEIIIELAGDDHQGGPLCTRHAVVHPQGQMPLTGSGRDGA